MIKKREINSFHDFFDLGLDRLLPKLINNNPSPIMLNLGGGNKEIEGTINLQLPDWNAEHDLIPYPDNSVSEIHAYHFLEHVDNLEHLMSECSRVLMFGGVMNIAVPYYKSQLAFSDFNHVRFFAEKTFPKMLVNKDNYYKNIFSEIRLKVHFQVIAGIQEDSMMLFVQLVRY